MSFHSTFLLPNPKIACQTSVNTVTPSQQTRPTMRAALPFFTKENTLVRKPIATIAIQMKNLERDFSGANQSAPIPNPPAIVVIRLAKIKYKIKVGKPVRRDFLSALRPFPRVCQIAKTVVIGIMAKVRA